MWVELSENFQRVRVGIDLPTGDHRRDDEARFQEQVPWLLPRHALGIRPSDGVHRHPLVRVQLRLQEPIGK